MYKLIQIFMEVIICPHVKLTEIAKVFDVEGAELLRGLYAQEFRLQLSGKMAGVAFGRCVGISYGRGVAKKSRASIYVRPMRKNHAYTASRPSR